MSDTDFFHGIDRTHLGIEFRYPATYDLRVEVSVRADGFTVFIPGVPARCETLSRPQARALYEFLGEELGMFS